MLLVLSKYFTTLTAPTISGVLDAATQDGLRWLQSKTDLPQTGELNTQTWHALNSLYRITVGTGE